MIGLRAFEFGGITSMSAVERRVFLQLRFLLKRLPMSPNASVVSKNKVQKSLIESIENLYTTYLLN